MLTLEKRDLCRNPLRRSSSGSELDPVPNLEFGPVAKTQVHDGCQSFRFASPFNLCIYDAYDITDLYFASQFRL